MKKVLSLLLVLALVFALCACGKTAEPVELTEAERDAAVVFDNDSTPMDTSTLDAAELAKIKVGFFTLHDENSPYDKNFIDAAQAVCDALGVEFLIKTNIGENEEAYNAAAELVDAGCNIIFADSFGHESYMIQAAKEFPDVEFCHATGTQAHTVNLANYHNAFANIYDGRYLAGVAAGMKLNEMIANGDITEDEAKMGYVGALPYAEVISGYTSYYLGARSICPSATMEVTYTGSWYDETAEKEGANNLINRGCVLISQHADSMGAPTACEDAGVPDVSYNGSTISVAPNTYLISSRINWEEYYKVMIGTVAKGEKIHADWTGTLENGGVALTELNGAVAAADTQAKLDEVRAALIAGTTHVFDTSTFTVNGETLTSYLADVNDWGDFTGETEVVFDGYFHESEFRSAPAFDLIIDGITLIDQ